MYPFGMERFYGGLKLAITKGGIPVPIEWTTGRMVPDYVLNLCKYATKDLVVYVAGESEGKPTIERYQVVDIQQKSEQIHEIGRGGTIHLTGNRDYVEVYLKPVGAKNGSSWIAVKLDDLYISKEALIREMVRKRLSDLTSLWGDDNAEPFRDSLDSFIGKLEEVRNEMVKLKTFLGNPF